MITINAAQQQAACLIRLVLGWFIVPLAVNNWAWGSQLVATCTKAGKNSKEAQLYSAKPRLVSAYEHDMMGPKPSLDNPLPCQLVPKQALQNSWHQQLSSKRTRISIDGHQGLMSQYFYHARDVWFIHVHTFTLNRHRSSCIQYLLCMSRRHACRYIPCINTNAIRCLVKMMNGSKLAHFFLSLRILSSSS